MSIVQTVIGAIVSSGGGAPTPTYTLTPSANSVDEGASVTFTVGGTNIPDGTYYWTIADGSWAMADFSTINGSVSVTGNSGTFSVTTTADDTTEGSETFNVTLRSVSITGTILATSTSVTITDTSLTPVAPFSLSFNGSSSYLGVQNTQSDWALNRTWTIEFWSKANTASSAGNLLTVMCQDYGDDNSIQILYQNGFQIKGGTTLAAEPTPGVWTHVALVSTVGDGVTLYYNGVSQSTGGYYSLNNSSADLAIGKRGPGNFQYFNGKLAMIRISNTAKYLDNFSPSLSYGREADTRMMLGSDNPLTDLALYELNGITTSNSNGDTLYFSKATYPDLNNQVRSGDTVVNVDGTGAATSTTTGAVFTSDPDNWGVNISPSQNFGTKNFSGPGRHPIDNQGAVISTDFPSFQSLEFVENQGDYLDVAQPNYTVLGSSDAHAHYGPLSNGKIFKGSYPEPQVGWILIGNSYGGPYQVTIATVTDGGATWDLTWSPQFADNLYMDENYSLYDPALAAFNLSSTWTMEFWLKANAASQTAGGGIWGLLNQVGWSTTNSIVVALSDNKLVFLSVAESANADVRYTEPTVGQWTHVAIVNNAGTQTVWYNGVEQTKVSGTFGTASYTNGIAPLRIGRLGPQNGGTLNGKMAMVRISSTAKYTEAFTATTTYGVEADTRLFLGKVNSTVDAKNHTVTNNGVTTSTDFPT